MRQVLKRYQDRHLTDREFRTLQGVLTTDFGVIEQEHEQKKKKLRMAQRLRKDVQKVRSKKSLVLDAGAGNKKPRRSLSSGNLDQLALPP